MNPIHPAWSTLPSDAQDCFARLGRLVPQLTARLRPDTTFATAGLDSLEVVELLCAIESDRGVRLSLDDLTPSTTVGDLIVLVAARAPVSAQPI